VNRNIFKELSPVWLGAGTGGLLIVILFATETVFGRWQLLLTEEGFDAFARVSTGELRDFRIAVIHCLLVGYLAGALLYIVRSSRQIVLMLQGVLNCTREECEKIASSVKLSVGGLIVVGVLGFATALAGPYLVPPIPEAPWTPSSWSPEVAWHRILGTVATVGSWWMGYAIVTMSIRLSNIAKKLQKIDLFDLSPMAPFTQFGLRNALLLAGSLSIWSLMMFETGFGQIMLFVGGITLVSMGFALFLPVYGVHKRIQQSKNEELVWLTNEIAKRRHGFQNSSGIKTSGEMADIITYRGLVESVSDWPFTMSTYARLVFYALIPLLSWGISIISEEIVGRLLF